MSEAEIIKGCKARQRRAQKKLYDTYAPVLLGICRRYVKDVTDAEDVLLEAMYKIMANIHTFQGKGSFEGWMKRITINEALMFLRRRHNFNLSIDASHIAIADDDQSVEEDLFEADILAVLDQLPKGYKTVFNLYVVEGYKHREIAEILGISINTSKSQLIQAKRKLAGLLKKNQILANAG